MAVIEQDGIDRAGPGPSRIVRRKLTSAELLAFDGTNQIDLIRAPGAGRMIIIEDVVVRYEAGDTAYTDNATPADLQLRFGATNFQTFDVSGTGAGDLSMNATTDAVRLTRPANSDRIITLNQGINVNLSGAITAGNGTLDVVIRYWVLELD